jgi:hypothetical protein
VTLIGKHGEITVKGTECTAVITNAILEKRYGSVVVFSIDDLAKWMKILKINRTADGRIRLSSWH